MHRKRASLITQSGGRPGRPLSLGGPAAGKNQTASQWQLFPAVLGVKRNAFLALLALLQWWVYKARGRVYSSGEKETDLIYSLNP